MAPRQEDPDDDAVYELAVVAKHPNMRGIKRKADAEMDGGKGRKIFVGTKAFKDLLVAEVDSSFQTSQDGHTINPATGSCEKLSSVELEKRFWRLLASYKRLTEPHDDKVHRHTLGDLVSTFKEAVDGLWDTFHWKSPQDMQRLTRAVHEHLVAVLLLLETSYKELCNYHCQQTLTGYNDTDATLVIGRFQRAVSDAFGSPTCLACRKLVADVEDLAFQPRQDELSRKVRSLLSKLRLEKSLVKGIDTLLSGQDLPSSWSGCPGYHKPDSEEGDPNAICPSSDEEEEED